MVCILSSKKYHIILHESGLGNCRPLCQSCSSRFRTGALKKTCRNTDQPLIIHSDRGSQCLYLSILKFFITPLGSIATATICLLATLKNYMRGYVLCRQLSWQNFSFYFVLNLDTGPKYFIKLMRLYYP